MTFRWTWSSALATVLLLHFSLTNAGEDKKASANQPAAHKAGTAASAQAGPPHTVSARQGYDLRLWISNFGTVGGVARPTNSPPEVLGCEFPAGSDVEHLYGAGVWIGGIVDTARPGRPPSQATLVSTGYEGWAGPLQELYPSDSPLDMIWTASVSDSTKPAGWDEYWGSSLPFVPVSDQDFYCTYTDTFNTAIQQHVPLRIKVIQKSYAWVGGYADAIVPIEYWIINVGTKIIKDAYIGYFTDTDLGPYYVTTANGYTHDFWTQNFTGYYKELRTAYCFNPVDRGSTPLGVTLLGTPRPLDSLKYSFRWYRGEESPTPDPERYKWLSSGEIKPDQSINDLSDTRFLFGFGAFDIKPNDTLKIVMAIISGNDLDDLKENAIRALKLAQRGYKVPITPPSPPLHVNLGQRRVELDWKWRPGDKGIDPETVVDDSNKIAQADTTKNGKVFEGYKLYRSENPSGGVASFTLLRQVDMIDPWSQNTGLEYQFIDSNLVRGKTYWYAVTSFTIPDYSIVSAKNPDGSVTTDTILVQPLESSVLANATRVDLPFATSQKVGQVTVVPNPYRTDANYTLESGGWEGRSISWNEGKRVIKFIYLPQECTIRIFTLVGELVATIEHRPGMPGYDPDRGEEDWHLFSQSNRAIASGVYLFTVESDLGRQVGKFVIIK